MEDKLNEFIIFLNGPKFTGTESDGDRKDWISVSDVICELRKWRHDLIPD